MIPIRAEKPSPIAGALYVSPQRTPGFADDATVAVTVRRMVISRRIRDLIPLWASFVREFLNSKVATPLPVVKILFVTKRFEQCRLRSTSSCMLTLNS